MIKFDKYGQNRWVDEITHFESPALFLLHAHDYVMKNRTKQQEAMSTWFDACSILYNARSEYLKDYGYSQD